MGRIEQFSLEKTLSLNKITKALIKEHFQDLRKFVTYAKYGKKPDHSILPPMEHVALNLRYLGWSGETQYGGFIKIRVDPIFKEAGTDAIIGGIAHELGHVVVENSQEAIAEKDLEYAADTVVIQRGLTKYLYETSKFLENLPTHLGIPNLQVSREGFSSDALAYLIEKLS